MVFWKHQKAHTTTSKGSWNQMSPWWHCTCNTRLEFPCSIPRNCLSVQSLEQIPVWNNGLLPQLSPTQTSFHRTAKGATMKRHYGTIRSLGLLPFGDFLSSNLQHTTPKEELHSKITARLMESPGLLKKGRKRTCTTLSRQLETLWTKAKQ